ncbi:MAG: family F420-dependent class oxidoreductase [Acidimicrobiales bacterium]|nr:family F420-dependent class oxidoreductase [Acidimicrobiales bacterium]
MKFWYAIAFAPMDHMMGIAKTADEVGFEGLNLAHHIVTPETIRSPYPYTDDNTIWWDPAAPFPDPWVLSAALAAVTTRIKFCTSIFILPSQDPFTVAKAVSTAAVISGDRIVLGAGAGWMKEEFDLTGQDFATRGRRMDEMLEVMAKLFSGKMLDHHGEFYDYEPVQMSPVASKPIPIYAGGHSAPALRRAARVDGWFAAGPYTFDESVVALKGLADARAEAGTADDPYECIVGLITPPNLDEFYALEALGATAFTIVPGYYTGDPNPTLAQRQASMEKFAREIIEPASAHRRTA